MVIMHSSETNFKSVKMLKRALLLLQHSAANPHRHVLDSVQSARNLLSVVAYVNSQIAISSLPL